MFDAGTFDDPMAF